MPFPLLPLITHLFIIFSAFSVHFSLVKHSLMLPPCTCDEGLPAFFFPCSYMKQTSTIYWLVAVYLLTKDPKAPSNTYQRCTTNLTLQRYPSSSHSRLQALSSSSYLSRQTKWFLQDNPSVSQERGCIFHTDECPNRYGYG